MRMTSDAVVQALSPGAVHSSLEAIVAALAADPPNPAGARGFFDFLSGAEAKAILVAHGVDGVEPGRLTEHGRRGSDPSVARRQSSVVYR